MSRKAKKEKVRCRYFIWLLGTRNDDIFYADGRSNTPDLGRHSLGTRIRRDAEMALHELDLVKAVEFGRVGAALLKGDQNRLLPIAVGVKEYLEFVSRPATQGGASAGTSKRYRPVFAKFVTFAQSQGITVWQQVTKESLRRYGKWLDDQDYHDKTQYTELVVFKQCVRWLVDEVKLPVEHLIRLPLKKPQGTSTYCYSPAEFQAIVDHCRKDAHLGWLGDAATALGMTGLRISELAELRWSDVDLEAGLIKLVDTTRQSRKSERHKVRSTKTHRNRILEIHPDLQAVLARLPRSSDHRVFHGPRGGKIKPDTVRNILVRDVLGPLSANFPATDQGPGIAAGRLHSFRHFFCSTSADQKVSEQVLMSWLGHSDSDMIRHYYHMRREESRRQMNSLTFLRNGDVDVETTD